MENHESGSGSKSIEAKAIIAVGSGKGGVGKSTVAVNLALAIAATGKKTGILDADIYGPNVPLMLGLDGERVLVEDQFLVPVEKHNLSVMSVAFLTSPEQALVWRGPLAHKLIEQFLFEVKWGQLDALVIDMPPGTGDVPLSLVQKANLTASVIVTTPQEASIADVRKMINMFENTQTPIAGIVENMKYMTCNHCDERIDMFPNSNQKGIAEELGHPLLSEFPFDPSIGRKDSDGLPFYLSGKNTESVDLYNNLAKKIVDFCGLG